MHYPSTGKCQVLYPGRPQVQRPAPGCSLQLPFASKLRCALRELSNEMRRETEKVPVRLSSAGSIHVSYVSIWI